MKVPHHRIQGVEDVPQPATPRERKRGRQLLVNGERRSVTAAAYVCAGGEEDREWRPQGKLVRDGEVQRHNGDLAARRGPQVVTHQQVKRDDRAQAVGQNRDALREAGEPVAVLCVQVCRSVSMVPSQSKAPFSPLDTVFRIFSLPRRQCPPPPTQLAHRFPEVV